MTHDELLQLIDFLTTNKLKEISEKVFTDLVLIGDAQSFTLIWSLKEFTRATTYM